MPSSNDVANVFDVLSGVGTTIAPALPGVGGGIALGVSAALGLVADLIKLGQDPVTTIAEIRSSLPDFDAAMGRVHQRVKDRFPGGGNG